MSTALDLAPTKGSTHDGDELDHLFCCDQDVALCGSDLTGTEFGEVVSEEHLCLVCIDLEGQHCSKPDCPLPRPLVVGGADCLHCRAAHPQLHDKQKPDSVNLPSLLHKGYRNAEAY